MRNLILSTLCSGLIAASLPACAAFVPGKVGQENRYQLSYEGEGISRVQSLFSGHAEKGDRLQVTLQAQMETVQVTPTLFSVRLLGVTHRLRINEREQALSGEAEALARPCYLVIDAQGRVRSISFAADVPVTARGTLRTLISGLELVQPRGGGHTWKVEQDTVNGLAQTDYRFRSGNTVEKRILAYPVRRRIGAKGVPQMRPSTQGALHFRFQADHLQRMEGTLVTQFSLASKSFSEARERFQLVRLGGRLEAQSALKPLQSRYQAQCRLEAPTPLHMNDKSLASAKAAWTQVLKGATTTSLLAELAVDDTKNVHDDSGLLDKLCALLTLHPETCADFEQALAAAQPDQFSTRMIVAALASVAGVAQEESPSASQARPFAERALINVLSSHRTQPDMVVRLATSLGMIGAPSQELERLLQSLADSPDADISGSCRLALGGVAQNGSPVVAKPALAYLKHKLPTADAFEKQTLLEALGNAGSADALNEFAAYAQDASASLRAVTMMSLRLVAGSRATNLLYQGLHDADPDVRQGAAGAFEYRPFSPNDVHAFIGLIAAEKAERVRLTLLENLHLEAPYYPQMRSVLQHAAAHDASADIRTTVARWLE